MARVINGTVEPGYCVTRGPQLHAYSSQSVNQRALTLPWSVVGGGWKCLTSSLLCLFVFFLLSLPFNDSKPAPLFILTSSLARESHFIQHSDCRRYPPSFCSLEQMRDWSGEKTMPPVQLMHFFFSENTSHYKYFILRVQKRRLHAQPHCTAVATVAQVRLRVLGFFP